MVTGDRPAAPGTILPSEASALIHHLLGAVPADLSAVAVGYHVDEMDQHEIARGLGLSRRAVGYRLERFLAEARHLLDEPGVQAARG